MSLKGSRTTADYLPWNEMILLVQKLERDEQYPFALMIALGSYTGLRISDLLTLKWCDVIGQEHLLIKEKKTGKMRNIHLHADLISTLTRIYKTLDVTTDVYIFKSRDGSVYSLQYINRKLKKLNMI